MAIAIDNSLAQQQPLPPPLPLPPPPQPSLNDPTNTFGQFVGGGGDGGSSNVNPAATSTSNYDDDDDYDYSSLYFEAIDLCMPLVNDLNAAFPTYNSNSQDGQVILDLL